MLMFIFVLPLKRGAKIDIAVELGCIGIAKSFMLYFAWPAYCRHLFISRQTCSAANAYPTSKVDSKVHHKMSIEYETR